MKKLITLLSIFVIGQSLYAQDGFQASLTPEIALVERGTNVGFALNIWGENQVNGIDFGFVNGLTGQSSGFAFSFLGTYAEDYRGVLWGGLLTQSTGEVVGWQAAAVNINTGTIRGLQSGWINISNDVTGVQLGLANFTEKLHGVQIGLANVVTTNEWFSDLPDDLAIAFPFVNWSF